ncbi:hypothetical protein RJT34_19944 [Clitoria ternatea]|uniref:Uncharacterized protein n=1 Tax=Clitoria ternatea TaxID=43366 RepID=A0AAN9P4A1_CLITE
MRRHLLWKISHERGFDQEEPSNVFIPVTSATPASILVTTSGLELVARAAERQKTQPGSSQGASVTP